MFSGIGNLSVIFIVNDSTSYIDITDKLSIEYNAHTIGSYSDLFSSNIIGEENFLFLDYEERLIPDIEDELETLLSRNPNFKIFVLTKYVKDSSITSLYDKGLIHCVIEKPCSINIIESAIDKELEILYLKKELVKTRKILEDKNKTIYDFISSIDKEMRSSINSALGFIQLAGKTQLNLKQNEYITKIQFFVNAMMGILNDLEDFSSLNSGKYNIETVEFHLNDIFASVSNMIGVKAHNKNIEIIYNANKDIPQYLVGPQMILEQLLINLSEILINYSEDGEFLFLIDKIDQRDGEVTINIQLTSLCAFIDAAEEDSIKNIIFSPDYSMDSIDKYDILFILGLSKKLTEVVNGSLNFKKQDDNSATFEFSINCSILQKEKDNLYNPPEHIKGMKALVVENNEISRDILVNFLSSMSFRVSAVASGKEAISEMEKAVEKDPYKLAIMNFTLQDMSGIAAVKSINNDFTIKTKPKIIISTAYGREQIFKNIDNTNIDGFLIKPVNPDILFDTIINIFSDGDSDGSNVSDRIDSAHSGFGALKDAADESLEALDIKPINIEIGLGRIGGNGNLYRVILLKFYNTHRDTSAKLKYELENNNQKVVERIVTALMNVSENIGATDLFKKSNAFLNEIKNRPNYINIKIFNELEKSLKLVLNSISLLDRRGEIRKSDEDKNV